MKKLSKTNMDVGIPGCIGKMNCGDKAVMDFKKVQMQWKMAGEDTLKVRLPKSTMMKR